MELLLLYSSFLLLLLLPCHGLGSAPQDQGGRGLHYQLQEPATKAELERNGAAATTTTTTTASAVMIGSRPPRCEGRCALCGRCEAVQVPVAPRDKRAAGAGARSQHFRLSRAFGGDESFTNYKPLNWRCRCADRRVAHPRPQPVSHLP